MVVGRSAGRLMAVAIACLTDQSLGCGTQQQQRARRTWPQDALRLIRSFVLHSCILLATRCLPASAKDEHPRSPIQVVIPSSQQATNFSVYWMTSGRARPKWPERARACVTTQLGLAVICPGTLLALGERATVHKRRS